ncbi:MAG: hypothetical protein KGS61_18685 [Verrucomicrobia bacterium]|nr:hypothetical protein [Verrucomicrobiota bacterium]
MLTQHLQSTDQPPSDGAGDFTPKEVEAYQAALKTIRLDLAELEKLQDQVNQRRRLNWSHPAVLGRPRPLETDDGVRWEAYGRALELSHSEVLLCRQASSAQWAMIQRFQPEGPYAKAHGRTEVLLTGDDPRTLTNDYAALAQHTLHFMASNLVARAQRVVWEQFPDCNPPRVVHALSERCSAALSHDLCLRQALSRHESQRHSRGIRV